MKPALLLIFLGLLAGCATLSESSAGYASLHPAFGGAPDFVRARELFRAGAAKGDATCESDYAAMCVAGLGGPVDLRAAWENLRAADQQGSPRAAMLLADLYARGAASIGVPRDLDHALDYARNAQSHAKRAAADLVARIQRIQRGEPAELVVHNPPRRSAAADGPPQFLAEVVPNYPIPLQMLGLEARVVVQFVVQADGTPTDVHAVTPTLPQFNAPAVAAIAASKLLPGVKAGRAVPVRMQVPIEFLTK